LIVLVGSDVSGSDMPFERGSQCPEMEVAVDPAELGAGFGHTSGAPAQRHLSIPPAFDVAGVVATISIMLSTQLVLRKVRARVGGTLRRSTVSVSSKPSRKEAAAPGWVWSSSPQRGL
jgi:hypothetical protein